MIGNAKREASWSFSVFRNTFVKEDGLWKLKDMSITPLITANWADGLGQGRHRTAGPLRPAGVPRHLPQDAAGQRAHPASPTSRAGSPAHTPGTDRRTSTTRTGTSSTTWTAGNWARFTPSKASRSRRSRASSARRPGSPRRAAWPGARTSPTMRPSIFVPLAAATGDPRLARRPLDAISIAPVPARYVEEPRARVLRRDLQQPVRTGRRHLEVLGHHDRRALLHVQPGAELVGGGSARPERAAAAAECEHRQVPRRTCCSPT